MNFSLSQLRFCDWPTSGDRQLYRDDSAHFRSGQEAAQLFASVAFLELHRNGRNCRLHRSLHRSPPNILRDRGFCHRCPALAYVK